MDESPIAAQTAFAMTEEGGTASIPLTPDYDQHPVLEPFPNEQDEEDNFNNIFGDEDSDRPAAPRVEHTDHLDVPDFLR